MFKNIGNECLRRGPVKTVLFFYNECPVSCERDRKEILDQIQYPEKNKPCDRRRLLKRTREAVYQIKPAGKNKNNYTESKECVFDKAESAPLLEVALRLPVFFGVVISLEFTGQY